MYTFTLSFPWHEEDRAEKGCIEIEIEALKPREHYGEIRAEGEPQRWASHARIAAHCARSVIAFQDVTGLEVSHDWSEVFPRQQPANADHMRIWRMPAAVLRSGGKYLVTAEPYQQRYKDVETWCAENGWECATLPAGFGFWFPAGEMGTRLVLISPPGTGVSVPPLLRLLGERLPRWTEADEQVPPAG